MLIKPKRKKFYSVQPVWGKAAALPGPPTLTFIGGTGFGSHAGAVETYTALGIGSTAGFTTRRIIFVIVSDTLISATAISSFTINSGAPVNGAIHVQAQQGGAGGPFAAILSADIATGTTADLAVTYNATLSNDQAVLVYSVDDTLMSSTTPSTGSNTAAAATSLTSSSFSAVSGGFTIVGEAFSTAVASLTITGYTQDQTFGGTNKLAAHLAPTSTGSVTAASSWTTSANAAIVAASWR